MDFAKIKERFVYLRAKLAPALNAWNRFVDWLPWNPGNRKVKSAVLAVVVLVVLAAVSKCHAADNGSYVQVGAGSTTVRGEAGIVDLAIVWPHAGPGDAAFEVGTTFIGMSNEKGVEQRNNFAWRALLVDGFGRFDVGIGPAFLQNVDTFNGSHLNFCLMLQYRVKTLPVTIRLEQHFSNGGTVDPNKGRDMTFLAWRFEK